VMRDQIPLHRPLFGVEPSGPHIISNTCAKCEKRHFIAIYAKSIDAFRRMIVKNSDKLRAEIGPKRVILG